MTGLDRAGWLDLLGLTPDEVPALLVCEGTWWRSRALAARLAHLTDVRETGMPDLWWGRRPDGVAVAYCPAYGAARVVEPVHVLGVCGTPVAVQIGSCGGLQPDVRTGDVLVPSSVVVGEGASGWYGGGEVAVAASALVGAAAAALRSRGHVVHTGPSLTTEVLLQQPASVVAAWSAAGHLGVDMEASALLTAAASFGMAACALLFVWDELPGRSWADPFSPAETAAQRAADAATWEVALGLV